MKQRKKQYYCYFRKNINSLLPEIPNHYTLKLLLIGHISPTTDKKNSYIHIIYNRGEPMGDSLADFARRTSASTTNYIETTKMLRAEADKINSGDYPQRAECERFMKFVNTLLKSRPFQKAVREQISRDVMKYRGSKAELKHPEAELSQALQKEEQSCRYRLDARIAVTVGEFDYEANDSEGFPGTFSGEVLSFSRQFHLNDTANGDALIQEFVTELKSRMEPKAFLGTVIPVLQEFAKPKGRAPKSKGTPELK